MNNMDDEIVSKFIQLVGEIAYYIEAQKRDDRLPKLKISPYGFLSVQDFTIDKIREILQLSEDLISILQKLEVHRSQIHWNYTDYYSNVHLIHIIWLNDELKIEFLKDPSQFHAKEDEWKIIHPTIKSLCYKKYLDGHFADAVETGIKELLSRVKQIYRKSAGEWLDGVKLVRKVFDVKDPVISWLDQGDNPIYKDIQEGFSHIFAGAIQAIRNPTAHINKLDINKERCLHYLYLISLLMYKIDEGKIEKTSVNKDDNNN